MLSLPEGPVIWLADDLSPSEAARRDPGRVVCLVTARGSDASHTAMMVRTLGIAAVAGAVEAYAGAQNGETVIVDGFNGCVWPNPSEDALASAGARVALFGGNPGLGS